MIGHISEVLEDGVRAVCLVFWKKVLMMFLWMKMMKRETAKMLQ